MSYNFMNYDTATNNCDYNCSTDLTSVKQYYNEGVNFGTKGIQREQSLVSKEFFSEENIKRIQRKIRSEILRRTKGEFNLVVDQNLNDVIVSMRYVYTEYSHDLPDKIIRQVKKLNKLTIEYIIPDMISNLKQYYGYIKDISSPIKPIPRPINVNNAGRNTLPSVTTVWNI